MDDHRAVPAEVGAARLDVLSRLADDLAHEIKNPLNAVVINLAVLRTRVEKGDGQGALERADVVEREVLRTHELIDRLLRLARPAADEPIEQAVEAVLADVVPLLTLQGRLAHVDFRVEPAADADRLVARPAMLRAALLALGGDAIAAAAPTGQEGRVLLRTATAGRELRFEVAGSGGVPPAHGTAVLAVAAGGRLDQEGLDAARLPVCALAVPHAGA